MSIAHPVTELVLLHMRADVSLEDASSVAGQEFAKLRDTLRARKGSIRQFWGQQVENQNIFVWSIDWESFEDHASFINSEDYKGFISGVSQVFDLEAAAPLIMHTRFTSDAVAAREAPVTELAFFMLAKTSSEEETTRLEDAAMPLLEVTKTVGTCSAFAVGWVFETMPHPSAGDAVAFHQILGWPSVDDHIQCAKSAQFQEAVGPVTRLALPPVQGKSMFHVSFRSET